MKILFLLKSDCANLALIQLYHGFAARGITPDVCTCSFRPNDMRCFAGISVLPIADINIHNYDVLLAARNIFDYPIPVSEILAYKGLIAADNTTLYDGTDVYGDVVFTAGRNNYETLVHSGQNLPTLSCGCLKTKKSETVAQTKKIVWIESGHFPYGEVGRRQEAELIRQICLAYPDYRIVVKPRYLLSDCAVAKHSNADHLFHYLSEFADKLPNLELWTQPCTVAEAIADAQTVIHTYSSAFQEAAVLDKAIINIGDIETEETVDLRRNRFNRIKAYIDKAGQTVCRAEVIGLLPHGVKCTEAYRAFILGTADDPIQAMVTSLCLLHAHWKEDRAIPPGFYEALAYGDLQPLNRAQLHSRRIQGAVCHIAAQYEYYLDDYTSFQKIKTTPYGDNWQQQLHADIQAILVENFDYFNRNAFNQAYLMRLSYEQGHFDPRQGWKNLLCPEAFQYFSGKYWYEAGQYALALGCLEEYLRHAQNRKYPTTLVDKPEFIAEAVRLVGRINASSV